MKNVFHKLLLLVAASMLSLAGSATAVAANSVSLGHGVKCTWVLVSTAGKVNTYRQVCHKGP